MVMAPGVCALSRRILPSTCDAGTVRWVADRGAIPYPRHRCGCAFTSGPEIMRAGALDEAQTEAVLDLPLVRLRLRFVRDAGEPAPAGYMGSAWRGALGRLLRRAACITRLERCDACLLRYECPYAYVFETPPPPGSSKMRKYPAAPHPFVLEPAEWFEPEDGARPVRPEGQIYDLGLVLLGRAVRHAPYLMWALSEAARDGLGGARVRLALQAVHILEDGRWRPLEAGPMPPLPASGVPPSAPPRRVRLRFLTPLRLVHDGRVLREHELSFSAFFRSLLRRASLVHYFHGARELDLDFRALVEASEEVSWEPERLAWVELWRRSSRQRRRIPLHGIVGSVCVEGPAVAPFWPFVVLGSVIHAGRAATMGLGRYVLEEAAP